MDDEDDEHGLERAFGGFMRKGIGPDDRGGGSAQAEATSGAVSDSIWALKGGLEELRN